MLRRSTGQEALAFLAGRAAVLAAGREAEAAGRAAAGFLPAFGSFGRDLPNEPA